MSGPVARGPNAATVAEQAAECFRLRRAGMSIDRIAKATGLSHGTVCNRLSRAVTDLVQPEAEAYRALQEGRLDDGLKQVYRVLADPEADADTRLRAVDRLVRPEERRSKLLGLDAPESLVVTEQRADDEASQLITSTLVAVLSALGLEDHRRAYALQFAAWELNGREGEPPAAPAELPSADRRPDVTGPYTSDGRSWLVYRGVRYDRVDAYRPADLPAVDAEVVDEYDDEPGDAVAVRAELEKIRDEFPSCSRRTAMDLKTIRRRLRELAADPGQPGAAEEAQRLTAEYRRLQSAQRAPEPEPTVAPLDGLTEADRAAVKTWPPELRARLSRSAMSRVIDRSTLDDPGGWGAKNDLRHGR
ncbi:hypothetical protein ACGFX8_37745 [Streptomyces sp. NPDC048362]|uniref:hypothetical protein n=1 Tax=Streptomyces sp. NPDC048362 TaxID=3365539 RepID=UPI003720BAB9